MRALILLSMVLAFSTPVLAQPQEDRELYARLATEPEEGHIWLTTVGRFRICQARDEDVWNVKTCSWMEMEEGQPAKLDGNYFYFVRWSDNTTICGKRTIDGAAREDDLPVYTFAPNGNNDCPV